MPSKKQFKIIDTLAFRLTLWYAAIFTVSLLSAFAVFYLLLISTLHERMDQDLLNETKEFSSILLMKGVEEFNTAIRFEAEAEGIEKVFYRLIAGNGVEIASSNLSSWDFISDEHALKILATGANDHFFDTIPFPGSAHNVRVLYSLIDKDRIIQIGQSLGDDEEFLKTFRDIFSISIILMIAFAGFFGWFMARRALMGVEDVTRTAINISEGDFNSRVSATGHGEEIDRLAVTFNNMIEHVQELIRGMKEMTDNVAHDLRSPITRIRGAAETTLINATGSEEYEIMAGSVIEECDRLLSMINTMLDISETEAGVSKMEMKKINISDIIRDACDLFQPVAEDRHICLIQEFDSHIFVYADPQKMQRLIANLLDNALKYTSAGGKVTISTYRDVQDVTVSFKDNGIGISEDDLNLIFNRFYRCDRSRSQPGIGLGLSLALAIARAHGGSISVSSIPDNGSDFKLTLPCIS